LRAVVILIVRRLRSGLAGAGEYSDGTNRFTLRRPRCWFGGVYCPSAWPPRLSGVVRLFFLLVFFLA
jgi:hypothetical protein